MRLGSWGQKVTGRDVPSGAHKGWALTPQQERKRPRPRKDATLRTETGGRMHTLPPRAISGGHGAPQTPSSRGASRSCRRWTCPACPGQGLRTGAHAGPAWAAGTLGGYGGNHTRPTALPAFLFCWDFFFFNQRKEGGKVPETPSP